MGAADEAAAGPPGGSGGGRDSGEARPIGVPSTYARPSTAPAELPLVLIEHGDKPRKPQGLYYDGAEYGPSVLSPEKRWELQQKMVTAGLFGPRQTFRKGRWDEPSWKAFRDVLTYANVNGVDYNDALSEMIYNKQSGEGQLIGGDGSPGGSEVRQGRIQHLTSATTLEEQVQQSAQNRLGRKLRKNEVAKFISVYGGIEKHANAQEIGAADRADVGQDTTLTDPASPDVGASQFIDNQFAQEEAGQHAYGFLDVIKKMVG